MFTKLYRWCLANKLSINKDKTNFVLFHNKNKPIHENFDCIETENMPIKRVQMVQYLGLIVGENLYWNAHVDYVCMPLVKFFGIFNHVKHFVSKRIARQLYFSLIYSRINYGIEVYGNCMDEHLSKLQVMPNKLLKLLLKLDYRTSASLIHYNVALLKIADIHVVNILSFVNECRAGRNPEIFKNYFTVREATYNLRHKDRLFVPLTRTELGSSRCAILGAKLWNKYFDEVNPHLFKKIVSEASKKIFHCKIHSINDVNADMYLCMHVYVYIHMAWYWHDYSILMCLCVEMLEYLCMPVYECRNPFFSATLWPCDCNI